MIIKLTPKYFAVANGFDEGNVLGGEAILRIGKGETVDVGTVAFDSTALQNMSKACEVNSYNVSYRQRVRIDTVGGELRWELTPKRITDYTTSGSTLNVKSSEKYGRKITSYTNGNDYLDKGGNFVDSSIDKSAIFGTNNLLGFDLVGGNDASFAYRLYIKDLSATLDYTPRYYANFYDENNELVDTQTLNAYEVPTAPSALEKEGFGIVAWDIVEGVGKGESVYTLTSSSDKDIGFRPVYKIKSYRAEAQPADNIWLERFVNGAWVKASPDNVENTIANYSVTHGDKIRYVADGYLPSQNVEFNYKRSDGVGVETVDGSGGYPVVLFVDDVGTNMFVRAKAVNVYFGIVTSCNEGGTITSSHQALRHSNDSVTITPAFGYEIETVTIDGDTQEVGDREPLTVDFTDVTAPHSVAATFAVIKIPIHFDLPEGVTVEGDSEVDFFSDAEWTFDCGENASFASLKLDGRELLDVPVFKQVSSFTKEVTGITTPITFKAEITTDLVTVTIEQSAGGTITSDKGDGVFVSGTEISLTYVQNNNYRFFRWWDGAFETPKKITLVEDLTVSATWNHVDYNVTAVIKPEKIGGIEFLGAVAASNMYPEEGEEVTLTATPDEKSDFAYWQWREGIQLLGSEENPLDIVWSDISDGKIEAYFEPHLFAVSSRAEGEGTAAITSRHEYEGTDYALYGDEVLLVAAASENWHFSHWLDEPNNTSAKRIYKMQASDVELTAVFKKDTHKISVSDGSEYYPEHGDNLLISFVADYGYKLSDVLLDGSSVFESVTLTRRGGTYLLENVTTAHTVESKFEKRIYTNGRKLLDYYPPVIASIREIEKLMDVLQVTDDALWDSVSFVMENQFIDTATAEGVTMWERELGIVASPTESLAQRKARLRLKWVPNNRFTMKWLHEWLEDVCGTTIRKPVVHEKGDYILTVALPWFVQWVEVFKDLERYKPANIALDPTVTLPSKDIKLLTGFAMRTHTKYTVFAGEEA